MSRKYTFLFLTLALVLSLCACGVTDSREKEVTSPSEGESAVIFPDPNLEAAIRRALGKHEGPIQAFELEEITYLGAWGPGITDLTGLEKCSNLTALNLVI